MLNASPVKIVWDDPPERAGIERVKVGPQADKFAGGHRIRVTPVPIPNTEVKPDTADGTAWETAWESRSLPALSQRPEGKPLGPFVCTPFSAADVFRGVRAAPAAGLVLEQATRLRGAQVLPDAELARGTLRAHRTNGPVDRPFRPRTVVSPEDPHVSGVGVRIASVEGPPVHQRDHGVERFAR